MARVLLGVSGGIAAYKACELTRLLVKGGHDVVPLVTPGAERFVRAETFLALARRPADDDLYAHLTRGDLLVVAPCTANTLAKLAHGLADNLLTEAALAHRGPVLVAPAMNPRMWAHPATRANVEALRARGVELIGPDEGETAEGEWGVGRMAEPEEIAARDRAAARAADARRAGACSSPPAARARRSTPCASSATARRAGWASRSPRRRAGAGRRSSCSRPTSRSSRLPGVEVVRDADRRVDARRRDRAEFDLALLAAAVADYRPAAALATKRPKSGEPWTLELEPTADIARLLGERKRDGPGARHVRRRARRGRARAQAAHARRQERRPRRLQRRLARRHRLRRGRERGRARHPRRRPARAQGVEAGRSPRRSSTRPSACCSRHERRLRELPGGPPPAEEGHARAGDRRAREGEAARAGQGVDPGGARDRLLPPRALGGGRGRVPRRARALADRRLRALRARPRAREAGPRRPRRTATTSSRARWSRAARSTRRGSASSTRRPVAGGRPARDARARDRAGERRRDRRRASASCSASRRPTTRPPPSASPARSRGSASSRTTTASSTARCSTPAARRSSSRSSR